MKKYFVFFMIIIFLIGLMSNAFALLPPYTKGQLEKESTHIIQGKVLASALIDQYRTKEKGRFYEYTKYSAWIMIEKSYKGDLKKNDTILVKWTWRKTLKKDPNYIDEYFHNPGYYPGETVKTHLKKYNDYYDSIWWNAKEYINNIGKDLPIEIGGIVYEN